MPNWKQFLNIILGKDIDEGKILLIPIVLIILFEFKKDSPSSYPGWIDLVEWGMLSLWNIYQDQNENTKKNKIIKNKIIQIWLNFYVVEFKNILKVQIKCQIIIFQLTFLHQFIF